MKERRESNEIGRDILTRNEISEIMIGGDIEDIFTKAYVRNEPPTFKVGREIALKLAKVERTLFSEMEEKESGKYIVSGITSQIKEEDFTAVCFALSQLLYNQSYRAGNEKTNTGLSKYFINKGNVTECESGVIVVTPAELCRCAYGVTPTSKERKKIEATLQVLHNTAVRIKSPDDEDKFIIDSEPLCMTKKVREIWDKSGRVLLGKYYFLDINPIFGALIQNQYGILPQDVMKRLTEVTKQKTEAHLLLLRWLSVQDNRKPHILNIEPLVELLKLEDTYKRNKGRAEKNILSLCEDMEKLGLLSRYEVKKIAGRGGKEQIRSITFYINGKFVKNTPEDIATDMTE